MDNEILGRLINLYTELGIDISDGSDGKGEAFALASGLKLITEELDKMIKNVFLQTADANGIGLFLSLVNESMTNDLNEGRQLGFKRLSADNDYLKLSDFTEAAMEFNKDFQFNADAFEIQLNGLVKNLDYNNLKFASEFIKNYVPVCCSVDFAGIGLDFDTLDGMEIYWFQFDDVDLPFYILETLKS